MRRCLVLRESWHDPVLRAAPGELDRLRRVLRLRCGDKVSVFDGCGHGGEALLMSGPSGSGVCLRLLSGPTAETEVPPVALHLYQAVAKAARMDWLIEKTTELGAAAIVPLITARGIVRPDAGRFGNRLQRWRRIAEEAARQCGLLTVPLIAEPLPLETVLESKKHVITPGIYGSLENDAVSLRRALENLPPQPRHMAVFIGPEGDFTPEESALLREAGITPVTFGKRVLRVETAALTALCLLNLEMNPDRFA